MKKNVKHQEEKINSKEEKSEKTNSKNEKSFGVLDKERLENLIKKLESSSHSRFSSERFIPVLKSSEASQQTAINLENEVKDAHSDKKSEEISYSGIKKDEQEKKYSSENYNTISSPQPQQLQESRLQSNFGAGETRTQIIHQEADPWKNKNIDETKRYEGKEIQKKKDNWF
jgi:hypothetical protein